MSPDTRPPSSDKGFDTLIIASGHVRRRPTLRL